MPKPTLLREQDRSKNSQMSRGSAANEFMPEDWKKDLDFLDIMGQNDSSPRIWR